MNVVHTCTCTHTHMHTHTHSHTFDLHLDVILQRILQPYVDDLIKAVFSVSSDKPIPKAVKYLFDFLDLQAADMGISDPDVLHTWKTNRSVCTVWFKM